MKSCEIKVFTSDHKSFERFRFMPSPTCSTQDALEGLVSRLRFDYPDFEFQIITVGPGQYNIKPLPLANA